MKKIILLFSFSLVLMSCLDNSNNKTVVASKVDWEDATYQQQEQWLNAYIQSPDDAGYALIDQIDTKIKSNFNQPESVSYAFDEPPIFDRALVSDAEEGLVVINGSGTAENGFGAEIPFTYNVQLQIYPDEKKIVDIKVSQ